LCCNLVVGELVEGGDSMASTILNELRTLRRFDQHAFDLLVRLTEEELHRFPGLASDPAWSHEDWAVEFFAAKGHAFAIEALIKADDDDALGAMLRRWLRNWLVDQHIRTAWGALRDRLEKRMERDGRFRQASASHFWCLTDGPETAGTDDVDALVVVAQRARVTFYPEPARARRRAQLGRAGELESLLAEVLTAAGGGLHISTITNVVARRSPHVLDPATQPLPEANDIERLAADTPTPDRVVVELEDREAIEASVSSVFDSLSATERKLISVIDDPVAASELLEVGRSTTALRIGQLKTKLIELAGDDESARQMMEHVIGKCLAIE
jgi:hypothetical protein